MGGRKGGWGGAPHASTPLSGSSEIKTRHDVLDKSLAASSFYNWNEQENQFPPRLGASDAKFQRLITTNQRLTCSRGDVLAPSHSLLLLPCNLQSHDIADARQKRLIVWKNLSSSLC